MKEVEVSFAVEPSSEDVLAQLTPENIIEAAETYTILSQQQLDEKRDELEIEFDDVEMRVVFTELENGYEYEFLESEDFFEQRTSKITVADADQTTVTARTEYTFDSFWSFVFDRLSAGKVRNELATTAMNLVSDAADDTADERRQDESPA